MPKSSPFLFRTHFFYIYQVKAATVSSSSAGGLKRPNLKASVVIVTDI